MNSVFAGKNRQQIVELLKNNPLSVGILASQWIDLETNIQILNRLKSPILHLDIMDGHFCPHFTVGPWAISQLPNTFIKEVHLMVNNSYPVVLNCVNSDAHIIILHPENEIHIHHMLSLLENKRVKVDGGEMPIIRGISCCPGTPLETIIPLLDDIEIIQLLTVNPGYGTKMEMTSFINRLDALYRILGDKRKDKIISIDGSLTLDEARILKDKGVDRFVSGSALFKDDQLENNILRWLDVVK